MEIMVTCNNINGNDNDNNNNNVINDNHSTCNNATNNIKDTLKNTSPAHFIIRNYYIVTLIYLKHGLDLEMRLLQCGSLPPAAPCADLGVREPCLFFQSE